MKLITKITTLAFLSFGLSTIAQDNTRMDKIEAITKITKAACENGPQSIMDLSEEMKQNASLYSEYYKQKDYKSAIKFWRPLFLTAPKYSQNLHLRGTNIYEKLAKKAEGELKEAYLDTMYAIHDTRIHCFGSSSKLEQSKAFDWYSYRSKGNEGFIYELFDGVHKKYAEEGSENDADPTFVLYWAKAAMKANKNAKTIADEEVLDVYDNISAIVDANISAGNDAGKYKGAFDDITEDLKKYDYLNPAKIMELAETKFRANPDDETTIIKAYKNLKSCGSECTETQLFTDVIEKLVQKRPSSGLYKYLASKSQKAGNDSEAIGFINKAIDLEDANDEKLKLYYQIAKIHLGNGSLSNARESARKMLDMNPNSGEAYIVIGNTYASSGKICGNGTDFNSHTVAWAAIDTWQKAKSVDPSIADEAQKLINRYTQYMPSKEEIFYEGLKVGGTYTISCLGVTTRIRASN